MANATRKNRSTRTLSPSGVLKPRGGVQPETIIRNDVLTKLGRRTNVRLFPHPRFHGEIVVSRDPLRTRWVNIGVDGQPDLIGFVTIYGVAVTLEVETKSEDGRLSKEQLMRQEMVTSRGGIYIAPRSASEAEAMLNYEIDRAMFRIATSIPTPEHERKNDEGKETKVSLDDDRGA